MIGVDTDITSDFQALFNYVTGTHFGIIQQCSCRRLGKGTAGADGNQIIFRLNHIAIAGNNQRGFTVGHGKQGFEFAQNTVAAPVFGQFHCGAGEVALMLFKLGFKAFKQSEGVGGTPGKTGDHFIVVEASHFARIALHDGIAKTDLAVAANNNFAIATH